jgi:hypothetical protein
MSPGPYSSAREPAQSATLLEIHADHVVAQFDRRAHNPILREAALERDHYPVPWLQGRTLVYEFA